MLCGIDHIDKLDFLIVYLKAYIKGFKDALIQNSFKAIGLIPFDPTSMPTKVNIRVKSLFPPQ